MEKLQFLAELAVIAFARLFDHFAPMGQFLRSGEGDAVDALQLRIALIALVIGAGHRSQRKGTDPSRRFHVRPGAEIGESAVAVETDFFTLRNAFEDIQLVAAGHPALAERGELAGATEFHRLGPADHTTFEWLVLRDDLSHLCFDPGEILGRDAVPQIDVIIKSLLHRRPRRELCLGPDAQNGLGQHVGAGMTQGFQFVHRATSTASSASSTGIPSSTR